MHHLGRKKSAHPLPNPTFNGGQVGSLKSAVMGIFTPWELASTANQYLLSLQRAASSTPLGPSRPPESETLEVGPSSLGSNKLSS